jgi:hypothetical protein
MDGKICSAPNLVRIPYGHTRSISVTTRCDDGIPPASYAYVWLRDEQCIGAYQDAGGGYAMAIITLTSDNESSEPYISNEILYSLWDGHMADDNRFITIILEARRAGQPL